MKTLDDVRNSNKPTLLLKEAAAVLGVDARTVSGAVLRGQLPAIQVGRRVLIPKDRFLKLFEDDQ